jgi:hypothetical protein
VSGPGGPLSVAGAGARAGQAGTGPATDGYEISSYLEHDMLVKMFIFLFGFIYNEILRAKHIYDAYCEHMENFEKELVKITGRFRLGTFVYTV